MAESRQESVVTRIRNRYINLTPSERKVADLLLEFPGDIASYSATELAQRAGVSKAATTRFFRSLGYENFEQARHLAREQYNLGSPLYLLSQRPELQLADSSLRKQMEVEIENLSKTFEVLDIAYLESIAANLLRAEQVWVLGFRNSYILADYARWQMLQVRDKVHSLVTESATLAEQIVDIGKNDVVITVGFRRRTQRFLQVLKSLRQRDVRILYLTEPKVGASINYATWVLTAEVSGTGIFDSYPAAISLLHLLTSSMFNQSGKNSRERFKQIEELHEELADF